MPGKRLFFALWPDAAVREAITAATTELVRDTGGRAVVPENLHITLAFLGSVEAERLKGITEVGDAISVAPFALSLDGIEFWKRPGIVALCASETPPELDGVVRSLWRGLEPCGFTPETRPFKAHVTLARKARRRPHFDAALSVNWEPDAFVLAESVTDPEGARYTVLRRWQLAP